MGFRHHISVRNWLTTLSLLIFSNLATSVEIDLLWSIKNTFNMPESATYDYKRKVIYVSNVNEYAKDGNGFISRISDDGKAVELKWISGLNSPTGLAVFGDTLYAADYDALVAIDLVNNKILRRYEAPDADSKPSMNDVAISDDGTVYVSGSASRTVYRLNKGKLEVWLKDKEKMKLANGLLVRNGHLIQGGLTWNTFDISSKSIVESSPRPDKKLKDFDGITSDGDGGFFVTVIDDARIWHIRKDGVSQPLSEEKLNGIDLQYLPKEKRLLLPQVGGGLSVYSVR